MSAYEDMQTTQRKIRDAAREILAVSVKLHLTQRDFELAIEYMKYIAYISPGDKDLI